MAQDLLEPPSRFDCSPQVDTGCDLRPVQQEDQILGRNVSSRSRRKGAAPNAAQARIQGGGPGTERRDRVREPRVPRVVQMRAKPSLLCRRCEPLKQLDYLHG